MRPEPESMTDLPSAQYKLRAGETLGAADPELQQKLAKIDCRLRTRFGMTADQTGAGVFDLLRERYAALNPHRLVYGASVPKIGILLAYFDLHPEAAVNMDAATNHELGLMIKVSSNEIATRYSRLLGLQQIQQILCKRGFYDQARGGGIWIGKHYGDTGERFGDPIADHSHAVTVWQCLRFYLLLEREKLVSPAASRSMRRIFESPQIPHEQDKFVKGLKGRNLDIIRKSGSWENWLHDTAVIRGAGRHYALVGLTEHPKGDEYLEALSSVVDDLFCRRV
jgi:beta-lactamase class A